MKKIKLAVIAVILCFVLTGCNYDMWDTNYTYDYAECNFGGEIEKINIRQWKDYDGEQIQIRAEDGKTYLLSMNYCKLVKKD